jgi:hypothetical protein
MSAMARELRVSVGDLPIKVGGLADHAPIYYATLLWNVLAERATGDSRPMDRSGGLVS